jgi:plastocyanin
MTAVSRSTAAAAVVLVFTLLGCSGGNSPTTPTPPPPTGTTPPPAPPPPGPPPSTATIVISANNTFVPAEVTVAVGGRVTFVNQNNRAHDLTSDPLHTHTDCPAIMDAGFIQPGQTKTTGPLNVARVCGFHDHMQENNLDLRGRIIVQ